jgi:polysaccharide export outer membrane protein
LLSETKITLKWALVGAFVLACSLGFTACDREKVQNETPAQPQDTGIDRLQAGDTIAAKIHQSPDFDVEAKIDPSGKVFFRLIGNVSVAGLTIAELEEKLQQLYQKDFDLKTDVSVSLKSRGTPKPSPQAQAAVIYRLHSGDKISMQMVAEPDIDTEAIIDKSGSISFPLIGLVVVKGYTVSELEKKLIGLYRENYFNDPKIIVRITDYAGKTFNVAGAVESPGSHAFPEEGTINLAQALAMSGGIDADGNTKTVYLFRAGKKGSTTHDASSEPSVTIKPGDTVVVPRLPNRNIINVATVAGEVNKPGNINLGDVGKMDLITALAMAGGYSRIANQKEAIIQRKKALGKFQMGTVRLKDVRDGKAPMVFLNEGDILIIKESR